MKRLFLLLFFIAATVNAQDLINETFEGTGAPSGWSGTAGANFDYAVTPLAGLQSLRLDNSTGQYGANSTLNNAEIWWKCLFKAESLPAISTQFFNITDSSVNPMMQVVLESDGTILIAGPAFNSAQTVSGMSAGTVYNIWAHYKKGTGANSILEISFDTAGNPRPNTGNKHAITTNETGTANANYFFCQASGAYAMVFDNVQVSSTDIFGSATPTATPTATATSTFTPTATATSTATATATVAPTATPTATPSATPSNTPTPTPGGSATPTPSLEVSYGSAE